MSMGDLSLRASFSFLGLADAERQELSRTIQSHGGKVADPSSSGVVYVLTAYGAGVPSAPDPSHRFVTSFWLSEMLRLRRWLPPDAHPFFEPPLCQVASVPVDDDGDVRMETAAETFKIQLPWYCRFRDQVPVWPYFVSYLQKPMRTVHELVAVLQLTTMTDPRRRFNCLEYAVNELLTADEQAQLFQTVLPEMARLLTNMPQMFPTPPTLLTPLEQPEGTEGSAEEKDRVVTQSCRLTKLETLTLVCGCFFGIFPDQDITKRGTSDSEEVIQFPYFTAVRMFAAPPTSSRMIVLKGHKIRCLLQYFLRVVPRAIQEPDKLSVEVVDFTRMGVHLPQGQTFKNKTSQELLEILATETFDAENFQSQDKKTHLYPAQCVSDTLIEDLGGHLQIDFANKFPGGGVLNSGCVQEEIRFLLSPELLVSCLLFAKLEPHEAFVIHGTERYSSYRGYGGSFEFGGNFEDQTQLISLVSGKLRRDCVIAGIDAMDYGQARVERQYTRSHVWRDLIKAYVGFAYPEAQNGTRCWPVASGNWGCGVFRGDPELKFLIQWLAASLRHRELVYVLFERDQALNDKVRPLLALSRTSKALDWDRQRSGLVLWLMTFLVEELSAERRARVDSVLSRATSSLRLALEKIPLSEGKQEAEQENKQPDSSLSKEEPSDTKEETPTTPKRESESENASPGLKKKHKTRTKELQQKSIQDFFAPQ